MGSILQLLIVTRWEVFCSIQSKMKFLVALLSATLVYGAAHPGHEDHGHIEYQQQEHEECYVDYEIVVDVTYIEECQYVTKTYCHEEQESRYHHSRIVGHDSRVVDEYHADNYHKRSADAGEYGYYSGPKCEDKKEQECHKHPHENSRKIPKTTCKKIVDTIS